MKKVFALVLTIALIATLTVASFAAVDPFNTSTLPATNSQVIKGSYSAGSAENIAVYSVNVVWGDLTLSYTEGTKTWSPEAMDYVQDEGTAKWTKDTLTITVQNLSNRDVVADMAVQMLDATATIEVQGEDSATLDSAAPVGGEGVGVMTSASFTLKASGVPTAADEGALANASVIFSKGN